MARGKIHNFKLPKWLKAYADERGVDFECFSAYHSRLSYSDRATVDIWTTHKYWVKQTNYLHGITERAGETGHLPADKTAIYDLLDQILFAVEIEIEIEQEKQAEVQQ